MGKTITLKKDDLGRIIVEALHSYTAVGELSNEVDRLMKKLEEKAIVRDEFDIGLKIPLTADIDQEKMSLDVRLPDGAKIGHWVMVDEVDPKDFEPGPARILPRAMMVSRSFARPMPMAPRGSSRCSTRADPPKHHPKPRPHRRGFSIAFPWLAVEIDRGYDFFCFSLWTA